MPFKALDAIIEEEILRKPLKLTIKRKRGSTVELYFANFDQVNNFREFIEDLIKGVKQKAREANNHEV